MTVGPELRARVAYVFALCSVVALGSTGVWHYRSEGWSWTSTAFATASLVMAFLAVWIRDREIELAFERIAKEVGAQLRQHVEQQEQSHE
jgi:hypothetical protein